MPDSPVAALDCGTNSTRLLVVGPDGSAQARRMQITRLGQGVDATGRLAPEAVERTLAVLGQYRAVMDDLGVGPSRLVATSAVRDASNGADFLAAAGRVVGVPAELLSGDEEGRLSYAGATADLDRGRGTIWCWTSAEARPSWWWADRRGIEAVSVDLGCVRLTERHLSHDPPSEDELAATRATIARELDRAEAAVPRLARRAPGGRLIGLAGTVSTAAMLELGLADYDRDQVHHARLSAPAVDRWTRRLAAMPAARRGELPGMVAGREDVIVGGMLVLDQVMARFGFDEVLVSESDILDGLAASLR